MLVLRDDETRHSEREHESGQDGPVLGAGAGGRQAGIDS